MENLINYTYPDIWQKFGILGINGTVSQKSKE